MRLLPRLLYTVSLLAICAPAWAQSASTEVDRNPRARYEPHLQTITSNPLTRAMNQIQPASGTPQQATPEAVNGVAGYYDVNGQFRRYEQDQQARQVPDPSARNESPLYMATMKAAAAPPAGAIEGRNVNVTYSAPSKSSMAFSNQYRDEVRPAVRAAQPTVSTAVSAQPRTNVVNSTPLSNIVNKVQSDAVARAERSVAAVVSDVPASRSVISSSPGVDLTPSTSVVTHQVRTPPASVDATPTLSSATSAPAVVTGTPVVITGADATRSHALPATAPAVQPAPAPVIKAVPVKAEVHSVSAE